MALMWEIVKATISLLGGYRLHVTVQFRLEPGRTYPQRILDGIHGPILRIINALLRIVSNEVDADHSDLLQGLSNVDSLTIPLDSLTWGTIGAVQPVRQTTPAGSSMNTTLNTSAHIPRTRHQEEAPRGLGGSQTDGSRTGGVETIDADQGAASLLSISRNAEMTSGGVDAIVARADSLSAEDLQEACPLFTCVPRSLSLQRTADDWVHIVPQAPIPFEIFPLSGVPQDRMHRAYQAGLSARRRLDGGLQEHPPLLEKRCDALYIVVSGKVQRCRSVGIYADIWDTIIGDHQVLASAWRHVMDPNENCLYSRAVISSFLTDTEIACYVGALGYALETIPDMRQKVDSTL